MKKTFELSIQERNNLCSVLDYAMENLSNSSRTCKTTIRSGTLDRDFRWTNPEAEQEYNEMSAMRDKLKPKRVQKIGWVRVGNIQEEKLSDDYQQVTWEELT